MTEQSAVISVTPGGELARAIDAATARPVLVEKDGVRYRLTAEAEAATPDRDMRPPSGAVMQFAGIWADIDADRMIAQIYAERHAAAPSPYHEL